MDEIGRFDCDSIITGLSDLKNFYANHLNFFSSKDSKYYHCVINGTTYNSNQNDSLFFQNVIANKVDDYINVEIANINELQKIKLIIDFHYYYSTQKGHYQKEHIGHILGRLDIRIKDIDKLIEVNETPTLSHPLTIVSLRDVNVNMRKLLPMIICSQIYDDKKKDNDSSKYLNIIIDEAHNILSYNSIRESESWKDYRLETFEEIIKEGRKFGVFLTIASQRPSDISDTIISQLHNYFLHRLINNKDIDAVERTISYLDKVSFDALPILPTGSCILAGLAAQIPVIINIDKIDDDFEPQNKTIKPTDFWT